MSGIVDDAIGVLRRAGVRLGAGMTFSELSDVEARYGIEFSSDHADLLLRVTPHGERWLDWRQDEEESVRGRLDWPLDSALFDVEHAAFWHPTWGDRPSRLEDALAVARVQMAKVPQLIPLFSHRYMPSAPAPSGSPVFSVYQTDVIYYGADLADYFDNEVGSLKRTLASEPVRFDFWSDLAEGEDFTLQW